MVYGEEMRQKPDYITVRVSQLIDEANKAHREEDKQWYHRIAQELQWASDYINGTTKAGCVLQQD